MLENPDTFEDDAEGGNFHVLWEIVSAIAAVALLLAFL